MPAPLSDEATIESAHATSRRSAVFRTPAEMASFHDVTVDTAFAVKARCFRNNLRMFLYAIGWTRYEWVDWHRAIEMGRKYASWEDIVRCDTLYMCLRLEPFTSGTVRAPPVWNRACMHRECCVASCTLSDEAMIENARRARATGPVEI